MAYFGITGSLPGILGELLTAGLNVNGMLWRTSPSATELEEVVLDWLRQMVGLPETFKGVIMDTASISSMIAVAAAREALNLRIREEGMAGRSDLPRLTMYTSEQSHSSIEKGGIVLGIGQQNVRKIEVDAEFRMKPDRLAAAIEADRRAGCVPFFACATVGTTSTTSIDPVPAIADICAARESVAARRWRVWRQCGGRAGDALGAARRRAGRFVRDESAQVDVYADRFLGVLHAPRRYAQARLQHSAGIPAHRRGRARVTNFMDYGVQLGRRFRALKFWFMVRTYGVDGIIERIREHIRLAHVFESWVRATPGWEVVAPVPFSTVNFRACPASVPEEKWNDLNERVLNAVNATGEVFLSHTKLNDRYVMHLAIGNIRTEEKHIARAWELLQAECGKLATG